MTHSERKAKSTRSRYLCFFLCKHLAPAPAHGPGNSTRTVGVVGSLQAEIEMQNDLRSFTQVAKTGCVPASSLSQSNNLQWERRIGSVGWENRYIHVKPWLPSLCLLHMGKNLSYVVFIIWDRWPLWPRVSPLSLPHRVFKYFILPVSLRTAWQKYLLPSRATIKAPWYLSFLCECQSLAPVLKILTEMVPDNTDSNWMQLRGKQKSTDSYCTDKIQTFLYQEKKDVARALLSFKGILSAQCFLMKDFE